MNKKILVTGAAGFIGFHLCKELLNEGCEVIGLDNINAYYDISLKLERLSNLGISKERILDGEVLESYIYKKKFRFIKLDIQDEEGLRSVFENENFDYVCNLAAQVGVRNSIKNPNDYIKDNILGFSNILECCKNNSVKRLVYASSSSVYGNSAITPFNEDQNLKSPISMYAATKKTNELMAHVYNHLYGIETIGLRFFTVYGPLGRPDMAMFLFTEAILKGKPLNVFNNGMLSRDFTYIDDIVNGVVKTILIDIDTDNKNRIYNIGNNKPIKLLDFIEEIERVCNSKADKVMLEMHDGDVDTTWASVDRLVTDYQYAPNTPINIGIDNFVNWYKRYYNY